MFEVFDNIPDDSRDWKKRSKYSQLRAMQERSRRRRQLIEFAKYIVYNFLNGPESIDELVDQWLERQQ